jgi:hypothetical protein
MYGILQDGAVLAEFVAPLDFLSNQPTFSGDALSLKRTISVSPSQRWELECRLAPATWDANALFALFTTKGRHQTYNLRVPQNTGVIASRNSTSSGHNASGAIGASTLSLSGWTGFSPAGTMIRFTGHSKIYMLTAALNNGANSMSVYPPLRAAVSGTFKHRDDVEMPAWLDTDNVRGMRYADGILMDLGAVKFVEAL